ELDYAYEVFEDDGVHIVFNGKDIGLGQRPQITQGKLLYETVKNLQNSIVFNGKNYGPGVEPQVKDGHFFYFRTVASENARTSDIGRILVYYDGKYYCDGKDKSIKDKIAIAGNKVICQQDFTSDSETKSFVVYNGKVVDEGINVQVSKKHYAYTKEKDFGDATKVKMIVIDGFELGQGDELQFSDESFIYYKKNFEEKEELIYNGRNLGTFKSRDSVVFNDGHVAFIREVEEIHKSSDGNSTITKVPHVFHDGIDMGAGDIQKETTASSTSQSESKKIFLSGGHIAFERKGKATEFTEATEDENLALDAVGRTVATTTEVDVSFAVIDGKVKTQIAEGSLRMKDGYFGYAKLIEVKEKDKDYSKSRYDYYQTNKTGDNTDKDTEFKSSFKYAYNKKPYIFKGTPNGKSTKLGQGTSGSIIINKGRIGYIKEEESEKIYYSGESQRKRLELQKFVVVDGSKKGIGDITTLSLGVDQYAFAENDAGRYRLVVNGERQIYPGIEVFFLENEITQKIEVKQKESSSKDEDDSVNIREVTSGKIIQRGNRYYLRDAKKKLLRIFPAKGVSIKKFKGNNVTTKLERKDIKLKSKTISLYRVLEIQKGLDADITLSNEEKASSVEVKQKTKSNATKSYKGFLDKDGKTYYLQGIKKRYKISFPSHLQSKDFDSFIGEVVTVKLKKDGSKWQVQELPE
ncbi:hypothetical protein HON22_00310, partial [Candidatus Peregrinibacteria bacterium]|nr:hypothetical protein [Candidatus Peregrinibacteria bacterium]